ncbi:MAG: DUF692 domain-containing protein [Vampirovibrionales bacterium]|nr:DUF692 domain-containing protein [Vampirovibrionales bacterium]
MPSFSDYIQGLPWLGFGVGLKDTYCDAIVSHAQTADCTEQIDWLEIIPENYMNKGGYSLDVLNTLIKADFPMSSHGVNLSLGSTDPLNTDYVSSLKELFNTVQPVWFSDHLSFSSVNGHYLNDLMPLPFSQEAVDHCVTKICQVQQEFEAPFIIENISYYAEFKDAGGMNEAEFLTQILEKSDCGLLLDINNVYVNSRNHGYDPIGFLQSIPLERVVEIHIAGHLVGDELIIDTHGEPVCDDVFELFRWVYPRCNNIKAILLERDTNLPPFNELMAELKAVRMTALSSSLKPMGALAA